MSPEKMDELLSSAVNDIALAMYQVTVNETKNEIQENLATAITSIIEVFRKGCD